MITKKTVVQTSTTVLLLLALLATGCACKSSLEALSFDPGSDHSSTTPQGLMHVEWWSTRMGQVTEKVAQGDTQLIFVGDSITHGWDNVPEMWEANYGAYKPINMGFSGDRTEHVLWRFEQGHLSGIHPKVAVVMIGTNNVAFGDSPEETADGVVAVCQQLRQRLPKTKILLLAVFPREPSPTGDLRQKVDQLNVLLEQLGNTPMITFLNIGPAFLEADGTLPDTVMPDYLHPNAEGYSRWTKAMNPTLFKLLGQ